MQRKLIVSMTSGFALLAALVTPFGGLHAGASSHVVTRWVDQAVSFQVGPMTVYGTFRHPASETKPVPGVVIIAGSGPTNRNGNLTVDPGPLNTLEQLADWLSQDGVASIRYDKYGSGETGFGPPSANLQATGITPYQDDSAAAFRFLARQKGIDDRRLGVVGHSEGALYALLLATGHSGKVPPIHAVALFEPLSVRYLTLLEAQVGAQLASQVAAGTITQQTATANNDALAAAVDQFRSTGTVPTNLPYGISDYFNASDEQYIYQLDSYNPETLAESLSAKVHVLLTCSNVDTQVLCSQVDHVAQGLATIHANATFVHLVNVNHALLLTNPANYGKPVPFSPQVQAAIKHFVSTAF
jgi:alpha-beta hydrolase superfamily lysophospholipase